jgi:hypothetical protein
MAEEDSTRRDAAETAASSAKTSVKGVAKRHSSAHSGALSSALLTDGIALDATDTPFLKMGVVGGGGSGGAALAVKEDAGVSGLSGNETRGVVAGAEDGEADEDVDAWGLEGDVGWVGACVDVKVWFYMCVLCGCFVCVSYMYA